jgi:hypothetical protein
MNAPSLQCDLNCQSIDLPVATLVDRDRDRMIPPARPSRRPPLRRSPLRASCNPGFRGERVRRRAEVLAHRPHDEEVHRDVALVGLPLELGVKALGKPHCSCDSLLVVGSTGHGVTVTALRAHVVDGAKS